MSEPRIEQLTAEQRAALEAELAELEGPRRKAAVRGDQDARASSATSPRTSSTTRRRTSRGCSRRASARCASGSTTRSRSSTTPTRTSVSVRSSRSRTSDGDDDGGRDLRRRRRLAGLAARLGADGSGGRRRGRAFRRRAARGRLACSRSAARSRRSRSSAHEARRARLGLDAAHGVAGRDRARHDHVRVQAPEAELTARGRVDELQRVAAGSARRTSRTRVRLLGDLDDDAVSDGEPRSGRKAGLVGPMSTSRLSPAERPALLFGDERRGGARRRDRELVATAGCSPRRRRTASSGPDEAVARPSARLSRASPVHPHSAGRRSARARALVGSERTELSQAGIEALVCSVQVGAHAARMLASTAET